MIHTQQRAFTLLELMLVVGIITILAGVALQYGGNFAQEEQLRELSRAVVGAMQQARAEGVRIGSTTMVNFGSTKNCNSATSLCINAFIDTNANYVYDVGERLIYQYNYSSNFALAAHNNFLQQSNPVGAFTAIFDYQGYVMNPATGLPVAGVICATAPALSDVRAIAMTMAGTARISIYSAGKTLCSS